MLDEALPLGPEERSGYLNAARADSWRYRAGRFVRRNRLGVAAPAAMIPSLAGGLAATRAQIRAAARNAAQRDALGSEHPDIASSLSRVGTVSQGMDHLAEAEGAHLVALAIRRARYGEIHPTVGESLRDVVGVLHAMGRYPEAEALCREALALQRELLGPDHREIANTLANVAALLNDRGDPAGALPLYEGAGRRAEAAPYRAALRASGVS